jgi:hypothetical protein
MEQIMIRAVAFQRDGKWIAQCLEYDLCTSAKTQNELARRLAAQLRLQLALDRARGAEPFTSEVLGYVSQQPTWKGASGA